MNFKPAGKTASMLLIVMLVFVASDCLAAAWKLSRNVWSEDDEATYGRFVEAVCDSKYANLNKFIRDPKVNPLYGEEDKKFNLSPDCADLPYVLRAYVAYKLRLPFSYTSAISGRGGDQRYSRGNRPMAFKDQDYFSSPQKLFSQVTLVNSGYFRMAADSEESDHYPVKISPKSIVPGTVYYDPDGHVAVVAKVTEDGRIRVIDAHPDRSISKPWFGAKFTRGSKTNGGGFKRWRPLRYTESGRTVRTRNHNIPDYSAEDQFQKSFVCRGQSGLNYYDYVRLSLAAAGSKNDPVRDFAFMMHDLHEDISYRGVAVNLAIEKGLHLRPHPGKLPWNIYGTDGVWEDYSTPSRDARLKVAFREFYDRTRAAVIEAGRLSPSAGREMAARLLQQYESLSPKLSVSYINSAGKNVVLSFDDVSKRLFDLSFDPYHSIEYRWGAKGAELATASDGETKRQLYTQEKRLRNQLERVYDQATPLNMGPESPVEVDVKSWLIAFIEGRQVDIDIIAINREFVAPVSIESVDADAVEPVLPIVVTEIETAQNPQIAVKKDLPPDFSEKNVANPKLAENDELAAQVAEKVAPGLWQPVFAVGERIAAVIADPESSFSSK